MQWRTVESYLVAAAAAEVLKSGTLSCEVLHAGICYLLAEWYLDLFQMLASITDTIGKHHFMAKLPS